MKRIKDFFGDEDILFAILITVLKPIVLVMCLNQLFGLGLNYGFDNLLAAHFFLNLMNWSSSDD